MGCFGAFWGVVLNVFITICVCHFLVCTLADNLSDARKYHYHDRHRRIHGVYYRTDLILLLTVEK